MTREADVVRSLVEMADTLVEDYDVVDLLTGLADRCVSLLGVSAAGVMLASPAGSLGLVASSSEAMRLLELFELQAQEGPCLDAFRTGEPVGHENLQAGAGRWPSFSAAALQAGFASASALPLRLREVTLGALNLLGVTRAPMAEADVIVARAFADLATLSITQHRASAEAQRPERAAVRRADQPGGDRAGQGRDLRAHRRRPGRGLLPAAGLRPQPQPAPHRCRPGRHRRHPGSRGLGPASPSCALLSARGVPRLSRRAVSDILRRRLWNLGDGASGCRAQAGAVLAAGRHGPVAGEAIALRLGRDDAARLARARSGAAHRVGRPRRWPRCPGSGGHSSVQGRTLSRDEAPASCRGRNLCSILRQASTVVQVTASLRTLAARPITAG